MSRLWTVFHAELPPPEEEVIAVGLDFRRALTVRASTFVGCIFGAGATSALPQQAAIVGCAFDAVDAMKDRATGSIALAHPIVQSLSSDELTVRANAVAQVRDSGLVDFLPILCSRIGDPDWLVRSYVAEAATKNWQATQPGAEVIARALMYLLGDEHSMVRLAAKDFASRLPSVAPFVADVLGEFDSSIVGLRLQALRALVSLHRIGTEAGVGVADATWSDLLGHSDPAVRIATLDTLAQIDNSCPRSLISAKATDEDPGVREAAAQLLEELGANEEQ